MIRANKKIGVVYCVNSKKYVDDLKKIIICKRSEGYCIETMVVDEYLIDAERKIDRRVFKNLDNCDFGIVFLTKDLKIAGDIYVSKPNVLIEWGYLRGRLEGKNVWCITDFPHSEIETQKYMLPSDYAAEITDEISGNNSMYDLKKIVDKFINAHKIIKLENYDVNDLVGSLILNPYYRTDFEALFTVGKLAQIDQYSLSFQQEEIFRIWKEEKEKLSEGGQIVYLFERMVFLPFLPEKIISGKLMDFLSVENKEDNRYIFVCRKILRSINEYEDCKRNERGYESASFYLRKGSEIQKEFEELSNIEVAPIIECVTRNYIGLCYLNWYFASVREGKKELQVEQQKDNLAIAKNSFEQVISISERKFSGRVEVFQAFAQYNLARTIRNLNGEPDLEYQAAISKRKSLSANSKFPQIFKLNFTLEKIHAEIDYDNYKKEAWILDSKEYNIKIKMYEKELKNIRQTPAADVSLFKSLEDKLARCKSDSEVVN